MRKRGAFGGTETSGVVHLSSLPSGSGSHSKKPSSKASTSSNILSPDVIADVRPSATHPNCLACGRWKITKHPFMVMSGDHPADIFFVGQESGEEEERLGTQFVGPSGKLLWEVITQSGLKNYRIAVQNTVRCGVRESTKAEIKLCRPFLRADIKKSKTRIIVPLGAIALAGTLRLANLTMRRGTPIIRPDYTYVPTWHPAAVLREPARRQDLLADFVQVQKLLSGNMGAELYGKLRRQYRVCMTHADLEEVLRELHMAPVLAYDSEFEPLDWLAPEFTCLGVSFSMAPHHGVFIPVDHPESPFRGNQEVKDHITHLLRSKPLIVHNAQADVAVAWRVFGIPFEDLRIVYDSMVGSQALRGTVVSHALKTLAYTETTIGGYQSELEKYKTQHEVERYSQIPLDILANPYATGDVDATFQITKRDAKMVRRTEQWSVYSKIMLPSYLLSLEMQRNGILMDWDQWAWRTQAFKQRTKEIYEEVLDIPEAKEFAAAVNTTSKPFSLGSKPQMRELLFDILALKPSGRLTDKGKLHSLDADALQIIDLNTPHPVIKLLLEIARINTYHGTFVQGHAKQLSPDGRLHPDWHNFTATFRRGSSPNVQNIPDGDPEFTGDRRTELYNMRMMYRARPHYQLVSIDYAQQEFRLAACYSNDDKMIAGCLAPKADDAHTRVMRRFRIARKPAKIINFGIIYGMSAKKLQQDIYTKAGASWSLEKCEKVIQGMWEEYDDLAHHIQKVYAEAKRDGYIANVLGQIRWLPQLSSTDHKIREKALRECWNFACQSLGHLLLEASAQALYRFICKEDVSWYILMDHHDSLLMEVPEDEVEMVCRVAKRYMESIPYEVLPEEWLKVSLPVEAKAGVYYGDMEEVKLD